MPPLVDDQNATLSAADKQNAKRYADEALERIFATDAQNQNRVKLGVDERDAALRQAIDDAPDKLQGAVKEQLEQFISKDQREIQAQAQSREAGNDASVDAQVARAEREAILALGERDDRPPRDTLENRVEVLLNAQKLNNDPAVQQKLQEKLNDTLNGVGGDKVNINAVVNDIRAEREADNLERRGEIEHGNRNGRPYLETLDNKLEVLFEAAERTKDPAVLQKLEEKLNKALDDFGKDRQNSAQAARTDPNERSNAERRNAERNNGVNANSAATRAAETERRSLYDRIAASLLATVIVAKAWIDKARDVVNGKQSDAPNKVVPAQASARQDRSDAAPSSDRSRDAQTNSVTNQQPRRETEQEIALKPENRQAFETDPNPARGGQTREGEKQITRDDQPNYDVAFIEERTSAARDNPSYDTALVERGNDRGRGDDSRTI